VAKVDHHGAVMRARRACQVQSVEMLSSDVPNLGEPKALVDLSNMCRQHIAFECAALRHRNDVKHCGQTSAFGVSIEQQRWDAGSGETPRKCQSQE
jgi:hypothetical protein